MRRSCFFAAIAFFVLAVSTIIEAQTATSFDEVGNFYLRTYSADEYGAHVQNWDLAQDDRGLIYVANGSGVLEYDGVAWRTIPTANNSVARSLAIDSEDRVFVGAINEIGYLDVDEQGLTIYVSLMDEVPEEDRRFSDVWQTVATEQGVFFQSWERLFRWRDGKLDVWRPDTVFHAGAAPHGVYHVTDRDSGKLFRMDGETLNLVSDVFEGKKIYSMTPWGNDGVSFLAATRNHGLFLCGREGCTPYAPELTDLLRRLEPYCATLLPGEILAVGTRFGGVVLIDREGRLIRTLNQASGLNNDTIWQVLADRDGGLWIASNDGLARAEVDPALSYFDETSGLQNGAQSIARHRGLLYAAVADRPSVFSLRTAAQSVDGSAVPRFVPVDGAPSFCWSLLSTPQGLLAGCFGEVYDLDQKRRLGEYPENDVFLLFRSPKFPDRLYVGLERGLARWKLEAGEWREEGRFLGIDETVRSLVEDSSGRLWIGTPSQGVLRIEPNAEFHDEGAVRRFYSDDGLPEGWLDTFTVAGRVRILLQGENTLLRFDEAIDRFVRDATFSPSDSLALQEFTVDRRGRVWILAQQGSALAIPKDDGDYELVSIQLQRESKLDAFYAEAEDDGVLWIAKTGKLLRFDSEAPPRSSSSNGRVWIRRVADLKGEDLFHGPNRTSIEPPVWPAGADALRFYFAATPGDAPERTHYRTRLDGLDEDWSLWSDETRKDFTNLWEGNYVFRVQARDVYGTMLEEDSFAFRILPPWYRTWQAYSLYAFAFGLILLVWARSHREEVRRERAINAKLREVDRLKDEFLANTSHELRTPLYGMTGLAESLLDGAAGELPDAAREHLALLVRSGRRLSILVDDILDFSKLEHHHLELVLAPIGLHTLTDVVLTLSAPSAQEKGLRLINAVDADLPPAKVDGDRLQQVMHNLVGNAIKYTDSGHVEVSARLAGEGDQIEVSVSDSGVGIAPDQLERIFDPFIQTDASIRRRRGGAGLGLAVTRRLIELHGGTLSVRSEPGEGSIFTFTVAAEATDEAEPSKPTTTVLHSETDLSKTVERLTFEGSLESPETAAATILAVDDEAVVRQVLKSHLIPAGYRVATASSGERALRILEESPVDLVLLDVMMPKMSGYEVCRALRRTHAVESLPVLFLSAMNRAEDRTAALESGGNDYIAKPVAKAELLHRVRIHLEVLAAYRREQDEVRVLRGLLPICIRCKKIRDDDGIWNQMEVYISTRSEAEFSHGICPSCIEEKYPQISST